MYVLEESGSVSSSDFDMAKNAIADSLEDFTIGANGTRVGFIVYKSSITTHLTLEASATLGIIGSKMAIEGVVYPNGGTNTGAAITTAILHFASVGDVNRVKAIVVITDGESSDSVTGPAIGVGRNVDDAELLQIVNNENSRVLTIADMSELGTTLGALDTSVCNSTNSTTTPRSET